MNTVEKHTLLDAMIIGAFVGMVVYGLCGVFCGSK